LAIQHRTQNANRLAVSDNDIRELCVKKTNGDKQKMHSIAALVAQDERTDGIATMCLCLLQSGAIRNSKNNWFPCVQWYDGNVTFIYRINVKP